MSIRFETEDDRDHSMRIIDILCREWHCQKIVMKAYYPIDFMLMEGGMPVAFAEVKRRPNYTMQQLDAFGGVYVSLHKILFAKQACDYVGVPFVYGIEDKADELWTYTAKESFPHDGIKYGGRTDRGRPDDLEPVVCLKQQRFERVLPSYGIEILET